MTPRDPTNDLYVPESAGRRFHIGFEAVARESVLLMSLSLLFEFRGEKCAALPDITLIQFAQ